MPPPRRRRRWLRILLGLGFSLGFTLVLLELALRLLDPTGLFQLVEWRHFYRLDRQGRVETTPGWRGRHACEDRWVDASTNALGLRGSELPAKAAGERRVLLLGDSFVWGIGLADDATIPALLEQQLQTALGASVRVGNAGMWGTSPREWAYTVERLRAGFQPDLVVGVTYAGNDPKDIASEPLTVLDGYLLVGDWARNVRSSWRWRLGLQYRTWGYLERLLLLRWFPLPQPNRPGELPPQIDLEEGYFYSFADAGEAPWLAAVDQRFEQHFAAFAAAAPALPSLVVVLPGREASVQRRWQQGLQQRQARLQQAPGLAALFTEQHCRRDGAPQRIAAAARRAGLPVLDLTPQVLSLADADVLYFARDYHYNPAGAARIAAWLLPPLLQRLRAHR